MSKKLFALYLLFFLTTVLYCQKTTRHFRVRTITAGINLNSLTDTTTLNAAIEFLKKARQAYVDKGYEVAVLTHEDRIRHVNPCRTEDVVVEVLVK